MLFRSWKAGILSKPETDDNLLSDAITNIMEALKRNVESKRSRYKDKILPHIFAMNTYWYIYMRTRNTELGKLLGEQNMKQKYKVVAEESAYIYRRQAWMPLVRLLEKDKEAINVASVKGKMESFLKGFDEIAQRDAKGSNYSIPDKDLRKQIGEATVELLVPAYTKFLELHGSLLKLEGVKCVSPESIEELLAQIFNGGDRVRDGKLRRRESEDWTRAGTSVFVNDESQEFRRSRSNTNYV